MSDFPRSESFDHFPLITQLGAIDLTRDTLLRPEEDS